MRRNPQSLVNPPKPLRLKAEKPPEMTERVWQKQVEGLAKTFGWKPYHPYLSIHSERGWPDLSMVRENSDGTVQLLFAELKSEKGKLTPAQEVWLDLLGRVPGVHAFVWRPSDFESVAAILREVKL